MDVGKSIPDLKKPRDNVCRSTQRLAMWEVEICGIGTRQSSTSGMVLADQPQLLGRSLQYKGCAQYRLAIYPEIIRLNECFPTIVAVYDIVILHDLNVTRAHHRAARAKLRLVARLDQYDCIAPKFPDMDALYTMLSAAVVAKLHL